MYILPYVAPKQVATRFDTGKQWTLWCFLTEGGTALWKTDEDSISESEILTDYLTPNGFVGTSRGVIQNTLFFEVDPSKTSFCDFYIWTEFLAKGQEPPAEGDVWRPFQWVGSEVLGQDDAWKWKAASEQLKLKGWGTLDSLWYVLGGLSG
jgi:hypothetical protein